MKRVATVLLLFVLLSLSSCGEAPDPYALLSGTVAAYGAEGIIYSPDLPEGEAGHIDGELFCRVFASETAPVGQYAIFLNSHADYGAECGVFLASSSSEAEDLLLLCRERVRLLDPTGERGFVLMRGSVIFYSTMRDAGRAERLFLSALDGSAV